MGKKRIVKKGGEGEGRSGATGSARSPKRKVDIGKVYVEATFNNTKMSLTDTSGNVLVWSSSGSLGFSGAKKGTPFAAAKVGELVGDKAVQMGVKEVSVVISGIGAGRESSVRAFSTKGIQISNIKDVTPVPHNGPRARKARRV
ncbi:30S ribosomal protein S11 [Candidatus Parcubacteria bacterium]|nr:30S ribosomal protein S11 [Candidatus Parcubacteria bacterium]